jgi:hypothetical protein
MLSFSGTLVERDSGIVFAAVLDELCDRSIESVGTRMRSASTTSKDFADAKLTKGEYGLSPAAPLESSKVIASMTIAAYFPNR